MDAARREEGRYIVWDADLAGFGLRVEPSGRKTFVARYRAGGGRTGTLRQATVGRYGTVTVDQGRIAARKLLGAASAGGDPLGERKAARQAGITVAEVCDWYMAEAKAGRILRRKGQPIKASTLASDIGRIEIHVKPLIGRRAVRTLSLSDIEGMQADITARKTARTFVKRPRGGIATGGGGAGTRSLAMLHAIFEHAIRKALIASNPAKGARKGASRQKKALLSLDQIRLLGTAMRSTEDENSTALAAIQFLLLSGFRRNETLGLRPEWILPAGGVDFPDTKAGPQVRPIGTAAMAVLKRQLPGNNDKRREWVFLAERGDGHFVGLPKVLARISARANLGAVTVHMLRHSFASVAAELGYSELVIAGLLGHRAGSVTASYVHLDAALLTAADRVSAVIAAALDGKPTAQLFPLHRSVA